MSGDDYSAAIYDAQRVLAEAGVNGARGLINGTVGLADISTGFDVVPTYVLDNLKSDSTEFGLKVVGREQDVLRGILTDAFTNGWGVKETTDALHGAFDAGYHIDDQTVIPSDSWAEMVARTELSDAANQGAMAAYQEAGIQKIEWVAQMGPGTCPECEAADGEVVNLGENFPSVDVDSPPAHPRCVCTTLAGDSDLGDFSGTDEQRNTAIRGGYSEQEYKDRFGVTHPIDEE